jgi:hypothetical protein
MSILKSTLSPQKGNAAPVPSQAVTQTNNTLLNTSGIVHSFAQTPIFPTTEAETLEPVAPTVEQSDIKMHSHLNYDAIADQIYIAIAGIGTDEESVYRALQKLNRNPEDIQKLKDRYFKRHKLDLVDDIRDDFGGTELEYALQLLNLGSPKANQRIAAQAESPEVAAQRIHQAVEGTGTDEETVFATLFPFGRNTHLLQQAYQKVYNEDLRDRIEDEMSGSELACALDLLETPYEHYLQEASAWLRSFPAIGFGLPWESNDWYDNRFWKPVYRPEDRKKGIDKEVLLELIHGKPHEAIDALFHEQSRWHIDCAVFVEVVQLYALRKSLGAKKFDGRIGNKMELRAHGSTGTIQKNLYKRDSPSANFTSKLTVNNNKIDSPEMILENAPIGSRVRWTSELLYDKANNISGPEVWTIHQQEWVNWQNENTIKLGPDRYGAQGVGHRKTRAQIENELANITADALPEKSKSDILKGIFISEIEIFGL